MNILFLTIAYPKKGEHNIYSDLISEFKRNNHGMYIACSNERRNNKLTHLHNEDGIHVLRIKTGNITGQVNLIEKGVSTISLEQIFIRAIKKYYKNVKFDLILYNTPPITLLKVVNYVKKRDNASSYLLLKDIFPQNAVDIGLLKRKGFIYKYFRNKEKKLYAVSDYIGCMSQANVDYIIKNNHELNADKIEICPNSISIKNHDKSDGQQIKSKYKIPEDCTAFIYGGNLGKPQGIDFLIECLYENTNRDDRFFIICGYGSEYYKLKTFYQEQKPKNILLINGLPKEEYDELVKCCDIGLIFLDHRFTIPNFPSRILSYLEYGIPVFACTDKNTDLGSIIQNGKFGWWCESNNSDEFTIILDSICENKDEIDICGNYARKYLEENYTVEISYNIIMRHF